MKVVFIGTLLAASVVFSAAGLRDMKPSNLSNLMCEKTALYVDVDFGFPSSFKPNHPRWLGAYTYDNQNPVCISVSAPYSAHTSESSQFIHEQFPGVPASTPVHSGVPYIEKGEIWIDYELPHSWVYGCSNQTKRKWEGTLHVEVPANKTYRTNLYLHYSTISHHYLGVIHYDDNTSSSHERDWKGWNYHEPYCIAVDITEASRTRNGGCQEGCLANCESDIKGGNQLAADLAECYASKCDCPGTVVVCSSPRTSFCKRGSLTKI